MSITLRPLQDSDFPAWEPLWDENNLGHKNAELTAETWRRVTDADYPIRGIGAFEDETLVGFAHVVLHPTTGSLDPVGYVQDVFTHTDHRQKGIAKALMKEIARTGAREGWARVYWLADNTNEAAQALYKNLGVKLNFSLHIMPIN